MENYIERVLYTHEDLVKRCAELGSQISKEYDGKRPLLIGLLKGSIPFMAELIKHIDIDIEVDFMKVSSYNGAHSTGSVRIIADTSTSLKNRDVLIIEDIVDTGLTLSEVIKVLRGKGAKSIEICTLFDKKEARKFDYVMVKYVGFQIPNEFIVGFGLDYNELYRNLPYIGVLKKDIYEK